MQNSNNLIWLDLEMTGLDPDQDKIIEIATIVTDKNLNVLVEGPAIAIHHSDAVLEKMDAWNKKHHGDSGLIERVRNSQITTAKAETMMLEFLIQYVQPGKSPICGNSICQDRRFLYRYMPKLEQFFHYRNFDVSVLKIIAKKW
jgi:oligoribonuclease